MENIVLIIILACAIFVAGYMVGVKFVDDRLTPDELADNVEYLIKTGHMPYSQFILGNSFNELIRYYDSYNLGKNNIARNVLKLTINDICHKRLSKDYEFNESEEMKEFMECINK